MKSLTAKRSVLALSIGLLLSANSLVANATEYGPLDGHGIVLNADDVVTGEAASRKHLSVVNSVGDGESVTINGATINAKAVADAQGVNGVNLSNNTHNSLGNGTLIKVDIPKTVAANGLSIYGNGTGVSATNLNIDMTGSTQLQAISVWGTTKQAELDLGDNSKLTIHALDTADTQMNRAKGISTINGKVNANALEININASRAWGVVSNRSDIDLGQGSSIVLNLADESFGELHATEQESYGLYLGTAETTFHADRLTIDVTNAMAVRSWGGANIDLGEQSQISLKGNSAYGVLVGGESGLFKANAINIDTTQSTAEQSTAVYVESGGSVDIGAGSQITTKTGSALYASGLDRLSSAKTETARTINYKGSAAKRNTINAQTVAVFSEQSGSVINLDQTDITVNAKDAESRALLATEGGLITANNSSLQMSNNSPAVESLSGGEINLGGNTKIRGTGADFLAINVQDANSKLSLNGKADIIGNLAAAGDDALLSMTTTAGSVLEGIATVDKTTTAKLNLDLTGSDWNMLDNSTISDLQLANANVNFAKAEGYSTLTAATLNGNGKFVTKVGIVEQAGDLIVIEGVAQGNHQLDITNNGAETTDGTETLTVVKTGGNQANFSLAHKVELGGYNYLLRAVADSPDDVELYATDELTDPAQAATSFLNIGYLTSYIENQTLLQRLGDLRNNPAKDDSGVWIKGFGGKLTSFGDQTFAGYNMTYSGLQLGSDLYLDQVENGTMLVGFMAGYTHTNPHYQTGSGSGKNIHLGYYATYLAENGFYLDSTLKFNHMKNQFSIQDSAGDLVKGTGKTSGITASAEIGKRFWMGEQQSFYLEPQAQLTYAYQTADTVKASNGLNVGLSSYNSTIGRLSAIVGYQTQAQNPLNLYAKVGVLREMSAKANYSFNGVEADKYHFRGNWFDAGVGLNLNFKQNHNLYTEFDYTTGHKFAKKQFDIGYRYNF